VTRRIKALYPDIKVGILTTYDFPEYREAARACGAYQYLSKGSSTVVEIQDLVEGLCTKWTPSDMQSAGIKRRPEMRLNHPELPPVLSEFLSKAYG
jgi:DNA-binding NarL/FixJ family response regulator